jgi:hypothetical protein
MRNTQIGRNDGVKVSNVEYHNQKRGLSKI